jgi:heat shock protein HslJ
MRFIAAGLSALLVAGCAHVASADTAADAAPSLADTHWTIASINGQPATAQRKAEMNFTADRISGNAGCNSFGGGYSVAGDTLTATQLISTKMACAGAGMDQENAVFKILGQPMTVARQADGTLVLSDDAGSLTLQPADR